MNTQIYKIDASGRALGRVATEAAMILRGKTTPDYARHIAPKVRVEISNAGRLKISGNKLTAKTYSRYSGYPGGLRQPSMSDVAAKHGLTEPLRHAITGMLPRNKLRAKLLSQLHITE